MSVLAPAKGRPLVVGANHRSSSLTLRDALFVEEPLIPAFLEKLKTIGFEQALVIATCDRVEVQAIDPTGEGSADKIVQVFADQAGVAAADLFGQVYRFHGDEAVRHIFSVASSLDSLIIGEPQVLGQVKDGHRVAKSCGMVGTELEALLQAAYATAKQVRSETKIGEGPVSIASAAIQVAKDLHGNLTKCTALLVGGGEMGELVGEALKSANIGEMSVSHPTLPRAESLARKIECHVTEFENLETALVQADIVLTSLNRRRHVLTSDMVAKAVKARKRKPVFLVDTGIPGDIEPAVVNISEAFLYDLNDLEKVAMEGRASREGEGRAANDILNREASAFIKGRAQRVAVPALNALRSYFEMERQKLVAEMDGDKKVDEATRLLVNRLLHNPSEVMRQMAGQKGEDKGDWALAEKILMHLYRLSDDEDKGGSS
jgi:glutamyl-tRNA reductase